VLAGTPNFLAKYVNGADVGNSGVFEAADNSIGLGTTTPFDRLHIRYDNNTGDFTGLAVQNTNGGPLAYSGMLFYDHTNALTQFQGYNNSTHEYRINNIAKSGGQFNGSINFMTGSTSRFFVGSTGNIGIGTTTPGAALDVSRTGSLFVAATSYPTALNDAPFFVTRVAYGSPSLPAAVSVGNLLGVFGAIGYDGTQFSAVQAGMSALAAENWTHTTRGSALMFATTPVGAMDAAIAQMSILPNGNVGIGTPRNPVSGLPTATDKLQVVATSASAPLGRTDVSKTSAAPASSVPARPIGGSRRTSRRLARRSIRSPRCNLCTTSGACANSPGDILATVKRLD